MLQSDFDIVNDSRSLKCGDIFVMERGAIRFLDEIISKKPAKFFLTNDIYQEIKDRITGLSVEFYSDRNDIINLLKKRYDVPKNIYAITGTNGKTSTAFFIFQIFSFFSIPAISIGTTGIFANKDDFVDINIDNTTPGIFAFYKILNQAKLFGIDYVVFEASSHGLDQDRIGGISVNVAGITNFTQDHLDYHKSMQSYFDAKMLLFEKYLRGVAVLNADILEFEMIKSVCGRNKIIDYGFDAKVIKILDVNFVGKGFDVELLICDKKFSVFFPVVARFQIYNICAAIGFFIDLFDVEKILSFIPLLKSPIGRMERVKDKDIFVDYAHTPDALEKALFSLRESFGNVPLVVVFGCGGDRDRGKRSIMGSVADKLADIVVVTSDNPRTEDPDIIIDEIVSGIVNVDKLVRIDDRHDAIKYAVEKYHDKYPILIAGKGHEDYQIIGTEKKYFSDVEEVIDTLSFL